MKSVIRAAFTPTTRACWLEGQRLSQPRPLARLSHASLACRHEQVMSDWAEATTMSMLGPVTCSALTVIDPLDPPDELIC